MADHHSETALNLLKSWRVILNKETGALSQGNIQELERLFQETSKIQQRLSQMFAASNTLVKDKNYLYHDQGASHGAGKAHRVPESPN